MDLSIKSTVTPVSIRDALILLSQIIPILRSIREKDLETKYESDGG